MPLEIVINLLYLIRAYAPDDEEHDRFLIAAEENMQQIVEIVKRHNPPG